MIDIGNLHVIDYYLHREIFPKWENKNSSHHEAEPDFDISTEQREGWTYDD